MAGRLQDVVLRGTRAAQPAATTVASGTIYYVTDEQVTERASDSTTGLGLTWEDITDSGAGSAINELTGDVTAGPGAGSQVATVATPIKTQTIGFIIDGNGSPIVTGVQKALREFPVAGTIVAWTIMADQVGDIELDVFMDDPGSTFPPTTSIVAAAPPELTGGTQDYARSTTLTGWTTAIGGIRVFQIEVVSTSGTIEYAVLQLTVEV